MKAVTEQQNATGWPGAGPAIFMVWVAPQKPQRQVLGDFVAENARKRGNNRYQPLAMDYVQFGSGFAKKTPTPDLSFSIGAPMYPISSF